MDESGLDESGFDVPAFGAVPLGVVAVPGKVPQGEPFGVIPGVAVCGAFGFAVEGIVLLGMFPGVVVFGLCGFCGTGVAVLGGGVAVLGGGVAVLGGGVAVPGGGVPALGVELCPAALEPAGGAPLAGALCATTHVAQKRITDNSVIFLTDIIKPPARSNYHFSLSAAQRLGYRADAVDRGRWFC